MSGGASWRVALRIARRDALRAKARTALIAVLIALPVAGAAAADVMWRSTELDPRDIATLKVGAAQARVLDEVHTLPVAQTPTADTTMEIGQPQGEPAWPTAAQRRAALVPLLPTGDRLIAVRTWSPNWRLRVGDVARSVMITDEAYASPDLTGRVRQLSGREPRTDAEIAIDTTLADTTGLTAGATVDLPTDAVGSRTRKVTVVGVVRMPGNTFPLIYVTPGALSTTAPDDQLATSFFISGPNAVTWDDVKKINQTGQIVLSRAVLLDPPPDDQVDPSVIMTNAPVTAAVVATGAVVVGLVLLQIVLMAGPALAVGARRQQRTLALLAAGGGRRSDLRKLVLGNGFVAGLVAGVGGVALGTLVGCVGGLVGDRRGWATIPRLDLRPLELAGLAAVGLVTAVLAAAVPARQASRTDVIVALTGRGGGRSARGRTTLLGVVLAVAGAVLAVGGAAHGSSLATVGGIALAEIGLILTVGTVVTLAARLAARAPLSTRMAMRDAQRHRSRTVPAVAAIMAAVAGAVAALMVTSTQHAERVAAWHFSAVPGTAIVSGRGVPQAADPQQGIPAAPASDPKELESLLRSHLPVTGPAGRLGTAYSTAGDWVDITLRRPDGCALEQGDHPCGLSDDRRRIGLYGPIVADRAGLEVYLGDTGPALDAAAAALDRGAVVVGDPQDLASDGTVTIETVVFRSQPDGSQKEDRASHRLRGHLWTGRDAPLYPVLGEAALRELGLRPAYDRVAVALAQPITSRQLARAQTAGADLADPVAVQVEEGAPSPGLMVFVLLALALGVAAVGTFSSVGLAVAEGRADLSTLAAVGASPRTRRLHAAGQALVVSGLGSALGLIGGLVAGYAICRTLLPAIGEPGAGGWLATQGLTDVQGRWSITVPWLAVLACVIGLPLVTSLITGLVLRSRLVLVRRLGQ